MTMAIGFRFKGSILFPVGTRFPDERSGKEHVLTEISACRWDPSDPSGRRVLALSDKGVLWTLDVAIQDGELSAVAPLRWKVLRRPGGWLDSEGLDFAPGSDGSSVLVSTEAHVNPRYGTSLLDVASFRVAGGEFEGSAVHVPALVRMQVVNNAGFEGLAHTADGKLLITANEHALRHDGAVLRRLLLFNASSLATRRAIGIDGLAGVARFPMAHMLPYVAAGAHFGCVEFESHPFDDRRVLALERGFSADAGNDIRLFELEFGGARDVSCCVSLAANYRGGECAIACAPPEECSRLDGTGWSGEGKGIVRKRLIFRWDRDGLADARTGETEPVPVDNYEGMCLSPAVGPAGERHLLLVNDDNSNPHQIGTQFVLLELRQIARAAPVADGAAAPLNASVCDASHALGNCEGVYCGGSVPIMMVGVACGIAVVLAALLAVMHAAIAVAQKRLARRTAQVAMVDLDSARATAQPEG
jgi:hypothetical protein